MVGNCNARRLTCRRLRPPKKLYPGHMLSQGCTGAYTRILDEGTMPSQCHPSKFTYTPAQIASVRSLISADRFCSYMTAAKGDELAAIRQYERNTALSEALYGVLQGFEVALRNSMHDTLTREIATVEWYDKFGLAESELESVESAKEKIAAKGKLITPSRIVAELTFGFWVSLTAKRYDAPLWIPHLRKAFPRRNLGRRAAFDRLSAIRLLRNSVAHHECILRRDLAQEYRDIIEATTWICSDTATWIRRTTRFEASYRLLFRTEVIPSPEAAKA